MKQLTKYKQNGFTLVEVLLATVVGALVIVVALGTLRQVARSRTEALYYSELSAHGRYALNRIRDDLANFYRSLNPEKMWLIGIEGGALAQAADRILVHAVQDSGIEGTLVEGQSDMYEVEYGLCENATDGATFLGRRCGALDEDSPRNEKGALTRVAEFIQAIRFEYFDGIDWRRNWQQKQGVPKLVRVSLVLADAARPRYRPVNISQVISLEPLPTRSIDMEDGYSTAGIQKIPTTE